MTKTIGVIVVLILIVAGFYLFRNSNPATIAPTQTSVVTNNDTNVPSHDNIYLTESDPTNGTYMADFAAKTLYTYDKDTVGTTTCYGQCATAWPPYTTPSMAAQGALPADISLITRADGSQQFAYKGMPLYYYVKDTAPGQVTGDGVGNVWHIVKL
jgi:predicted lipoprotein with Yx(FWY)xxD motif